MKTLANDIKNKSFKNAYLLFGEEEYLKLNYKNRLIKSIAGDDTMNLGMYEGKNIDINEVIDSAETVPFFAESHGSGLLLAFLFCLSRYVPLFFRQSHLICSSLNSLFFIKSRYLIFLFNTLTFLL